MIHRMRLMVLLARPAVILLLGMFAAIGLAQAGRGDDPVMLARVLVVVIAFLLFCVACNDLADETIDRVNLPRDRRRPLVTGFAGRRDMVTLAVTCGVIALLGAAVAPGGRWPNVPALAVTAAGLAVGAGYSLRPVRIAERGALASLVLPAGYVAVPYLLGVLAVRSAVTGGDLLLLGGLYVAFIGRMLLKDFRDVRGDALFGKRTFLVRHGRRWTCVFSGCCLTAGAGLLLAAGCATVTLVVGYAVGTGLSLVLLRALSQGHGARRDEWLISALAILGRGMLLILFITLAARTAQLAALPRDLLTAAVATIIYAQALTTARQGPLAATTIATAHLPSPTITLAATRFEHTTNQK